MLRAAWNDPQASVDVEKILNHIPELDLWSPESLKYVHDTQSADFMIPNHLVDNVTKLFRNDHREAFLKLLFERFSSLL